MTAPQLHLLLNHVPVLGIVFVALALAAGVLRRADALVRFGLACLVGVALVTIPVYFSGEPAEKSLDRIVKLPESVIAPHENAAKIAAILVGALGLVALVALVRARGRAVPRGLASIVLLATLGVAGVFSWTAHLGGQIRHTELRSGSAAADAPAQGETGAGHD